MKNYTFRDFLMEKYEDSFRQGMRQANEDGARYHDIEYWLDDCDLEEEVSMSGGDIELDKLEYNRMINTHTVNQFLGVK